LAAILMLAFASISSNNTVPVVEAASPILWCYDAQILDDPFPVCFNHGKESVRRLNKKTSTQEPNVAK
jgi:hypothetical protein